MPVRARSRASSASRKSPQLVWMPRNSSSSASYPSAITPPSRSTEEGSARKDLTSMSVRYVLSACSASVSALTSGESHAASVVCSCGKASSVSRRPDRSRGRADFRAMRVVIRSTSTQGFRYLCASLYDSHSLSTASRRARKIARSRSGWCSQWDKSRLPMLVAQVSSSDSRVGAGSPLSVWVISRLRRVAASILTKRSALYTCKLRIWSIVWP